MVQAAHEAEERLLHEILGERPVTGEEVGEPEPGRGRTLVDLRQPARTPPLVSHVGDHRRPFRTHITRTYETPKVWRTYVAVLWEAFQCRETVWSGSSENTTAIAELVGGGGFEPP